MQATRLTDDALGLRASAHGAHALFTGRAGGVSAAPYDSLNLGRWTSDVPARIAENIEVVQAHVSAGGERRVVLGRQIHETAVAVHVEGLPDPDVDGVDAHVSDRPDLALGVLTADCMPIALLAPWGVGIAHAGWRGLAGGVIAQTVDELANLPGAGDPGAIVAVIGPCAGPCCYEVGPEVQATFEGWPRGRAQDHTVDLPGMAQAALEAAGVGEVVQSDRCTMCGPSYFSHRASGGTTGRQAGLVWRA